MLWLCSLCWVCLRESLRETQFSPNAMNQYGLAQDRRFPNEIVEKGSCAKQTCVVTTEVKATEIGVDLSLCWVPCWGAIAGCHCWVPLLGCHCWVPCRGAARCHCWVPLLGCHCWVPCWGAMAGCHCWVPLLGAMLGCHCWVPLREKIDQSVTPFSAAPFSTLITHKLACAIWVLCWCNF